MSKPNGTVAFDIGGSRGHFPGLSRDQIYCDNAGGSQVLKSVIDAISAFLSATNVQLGATYGVAKQSTSLFDKGYEAAAKWVNASPDEVVIGPSTTQILRNLSFALRFKAGDELVLSELDHETNIAPWVDMAERQSLTIKWWRGNYDSTTNATKPRHTPDTLIPLLSPRTALVAFTHTSNILGTIHDIKALTQTVRTHAPQALVLVDGVAFAPHRRIDVKALGVDFYAFSWYKVYGPHIAQLYARREVHDRVHSMGHYFNPHDSLADKMYLSGSAHELVQALPAIVDYFGPDLDASWEVVAAHEERLQRMLLEYLRGNEKVVVYGEEEGSKEVRVSTVSFSLKEGAGLSCEKLVQEVEGRSNVGFRNGNMYALRLVNGVLGLDGDDGVARISLVHYNTVEEVQRIIEVLKDIIG